MKARRIYERGWIGLGAPYYRLFVGTRQSVIAQTKTRLRTSPWRVQILRWCLNYIDLLVKVKRWSVVFLSVRLLRDDPQIPWNMQAAKTLVHQRPNVINLMDNPSLFGQTLRLCVDEVNFLLVHPRRRSNRPSSIALPTV